MEIYRQAQPCPHVMIDDSPLVGPQDLEEVRASWPADDWPHWVRYDGPEQRKRTCHLWPHLPAAAARVLGRMLHLDHDQGLIQALFPHVLGARGDALLWGAGLHSMVRGEYVRLHLDADRHRWAGWTRRLNAILFCEPWRPEWGGELELWSSPGLGDGLGDGQVLISRIAPEFGRLVLFETSDQSYHQVNEVRCPPQVRRKTLSVYFWGLPLVPAPGKRPRAAFVGGS